MWFTGVTRGYWWNAKVYDTGSDFGIEGGRISKLNICKGERWEASLQVYNYDRGLDFDICPVDVLTDVMVDAIRVADAEKAARA